jgi:hypothetical protein
VAPPQLSSNTAPILALVGVEIFSLMAYRFADLRRRGGAVRPAPPTSPCAKAAGSLPPPIRLDQFRSTASSDDHKDLAA